MRYTNKHQIKNLFYSVLFYSALILLILLIIWISVSGWNIAGNIFNKTEPVLYEFPKPYNTEKVELEAYTGRVEHIFFHPLIAYNDLAFDFDYMAEGFDSWFVTVNEFNKILASLYERGFILVDINEIFDDTNGFKRKNILLPKGKKPLILSIDDMNYYDYMQKNGTVHKLVLDDRGRVAAYTKNDDGTETLSRNNAIVPILDDFVSLYPDFSHNGAKGCIGLTGYEGVLGYRTQKGSAGEQTEREAVLPIISRLKATGWSFASHSYSHYDTQKISYESLKNDCQRWQDEVQSLIGQTKIYLYPYGSGVSKTDPKYSLLLSYGFKALCHVGVESYIAYHDDGLVMDRRHVDGIALRHQANLNEDLYNAGEILDPVRPAEYQ